MDILSPLLDWASNPATSNAVRTFVALLAIPGALWGLWLFSRWVRGRGLDSRVERLLDQNGDLGTRVNQLLTQNDELARQNVALTKTLEGLATQVASQIFSQQKATEPAAPSVEVKNEKVKAESFGRAVAQLAARTDPASQRILALITDGNIVGAHHEFSQLLADKDARGEALGQDEVQIARSIAAVLEKTNIAEAAKLLGKVAEAEPEANSWMKAGQAAAAAGRLDEALEAYDRACRLAESKGDYMRLSSALKRIAGILSDRRDHVGWFRHSEMAIQALKRNYESSQNHDDLEWLAGRLGHFLIMARGKKGLSTYYARQVQLAEELVALRDKIAAADTSNVIAQLALADAYNYLGTALEQNSDEKGALTAFQKAQQISERHGSADARERNDGRIERLTKALPKATPETNAPKEAV